MPSPETMREWYAISGEEVTPQSSFIFGFLRESNRIEGEGPPTAAQILAAERFLALDSLTVDDLCALAESITDRGKLRDKPGMDVRVGSHRPPPGSPRMRQALKGVLDLARPGAWAPYDVHVEFESLHPFPRRQRSRGAPAVALADGA